VAVVVTAASGFDLGYVWKNQAGQTDSWERDEPKEPELSWYDFASAYIKEKWPYASPNYRRGIAETLTDLTEILTRPDDAAPSRDDMRRALREWTFSGLVRTGQEPPPDLAPVIGWLQQNTLPMSDLSGD